MSTLSAGSTSTNKPTPVPAAAAAADSDDDFVYSDAESVQGVFKKPRTLKSASSVKSESSTGSRSRLPLNIEKALLQDITKTGGIALYDAGKSQGLCKILDNNKEYFGSRGDKIRTKIGQRVRYLKSLPEERYKKVLKKFQVKVKDESKASSVLPSSIKTKRGDDVFSDLEDRAVSDLEDNDFKEDELQPDIVQSTSINAKPRPTVVLSRSTPVQAYPTAITRTPLPSHRSTQTRLPSCHQMKLATMPGDEEGKHPVAIAVRLMR